MGSAAGRYTWEVGSQSAGRPSPTVCLHNENEDEPCGRSVCKSRQEASLSTYDNCAGGMQQLVTETSAVSSVISIKRVWVLGALSAPG